MTARPGAAAVPAAGAPPAALVTGAARGIGAAVARRFAARGWRVGVYDVDLAGATAVAAELAAAHGPGRAVAGRLDVTDAAAWDAALAEFAGPGGPLDVLVNNAGVLVSGPLAELGAAEQARVLEVNVAGVLFGCRAGFPYLRRAPRGVAVNMGSLSCVYGQPALAAYAASKAAVRSLTEALDLEWRRAGVRACDVWPGFVRTRMLDGMREGPGEVATLRRLGARLAPDDVAGVVWRAATARGRRPPVHWPVGLEERAAGVLAGVVPGVARRAVGWLARA